jgi:hypothetical protein
MLAIGVAALMMTPSTALSGHRWFRVAALDHSNGDHRSWSRVHAVDDEKIVETKPAPIIDFGREVSLLSILAAAWKQIPREQQQEI